MEYKGGGQSTDNIEGTALARVLRYYNCIYDTHILRQKIVCPFHGDVNPSLLVELDRGRWFCFGCNTGGDAKKFVSMMEKKYNHLNDIQAAKKFLQILRSDQVSDIHVLAGQKSFRSSSKQLYSEAYDFYHGLKQPDWEQDHGSEVDEVRKYMGKRNFLPETLQRIGAKVTYQRAYAVVFPIMDNKKFRGWVCRTTVRNVEKYRKYLYNEGFSRATTLCGEYGQKKYVFVVEGYMDRLRFVQCGITNVVALLGWKMSVRQAEKLQSAGVTDIISALDNDECGNKGTLYLQSLRTFRVVRWCYKEGVKDPGEMSDDDFRAMYRKTMHKYKHESKK